MTALTVGLGTRADRDAGRQMLGLILCEGDDRGACHPGCGQPQPPGVGGAPRPQSRVVRAGVKRVSESPLKTGRASAAMTDRDVAAYVLVWGEIHRVAPSCRPSRIHPHTWSEGETHTADRERDHRRHCVHLSLLFTSKARSSWTRGAAALQADKGTHRRGCRAHTSRHPRDR